MILSCVICGKDFSHTSSVGRPPGACSPECKALSKTDPNRICRTCGTIFHKSSSRFPFHCSEECNQAKTTRCLNCNIVIDPKLGRFCSGKCLSAHYPDRLCKRCERPVKAPTAPPYTRMPRYCGETCRTIQAFQGGHIRPWQRADALALTELISYLPTPLFSLPYKGHCTPYNIPYDLAPDLPEITAKVGNSIAWWNYFIPALAEQEEDPQTITLVISYLGRTGMGGPDTPTGCLPLVQCWPWLNNTARHALNTGEILAYWRVAESAYSTTHATATNRREKINEWIMEFRSGEWSGNPRRESFFKSRETGSSPFVMKLSQYLSMYDPPPIERCYEWPHAAYLNSEEFNVLYHKWETHRRRGTKWRWADYAEDPPQRPDRTTAMIEEILEAERNRQS